MNKKGISAVMGVILMVVLTVCIATVVYGYINGLLEFDVFEESINETRIIDKFKTDDGKNIYYWFTIENNTIIEDIEVTESIYYSNDTGDIYVVRSD